VYESGSINDFVSKVQMLKNDSDLREQLSKKALDRSKEFDLKSVVRQYAAFLEGLV
jgi:glycosyltransferase involved in cell wall biosynthesis